MARLLLRVRWVPLGALAFVTAWTASAASQSPSTESESRWGTYLDTDGQLKHFETEYRRTLRDPTKPHHLRSFEEMGIGLLVFTAGYWATIRQQVEDWDDPTLSERFTGDAWRTDNNTLGMNFLLHPLGGGYAYALARGNHHSVATSAAYGFLSSFLWEFVLEFREYASINDTIVTPAAGLPIGEFLHKLGLYLDSADDPTHAMQFAQWSVGTGVRLDRALDGRQRPVPPARDELGLTSDIAHDFLLYGNVHAASNESSGAFGIYRAGFEGALVSLPGYKQPGHYSKFFHRADVTSLSVGVEGSKHGPGGQMQADAVLLGYHLQSIAGSHQAPRGLAATLGASTAFRYLDSAASGLREQMSAAHLLGPAIDLHARTPWARLDIEARAHLDYAGVSSHAYPQWLEAHPDELGKHIIRNEGYFYAWGGSASLSGKLELGPLRLRGSAFYGEYWSQDGVNRWQERITVDVPARTDFLRLRAGAQLRPTSLPVALGASTEVRRWNSHAAEFSARRRVVTQGLDVSVRF